MTRRLSNGFVLTPCHACGYVIEDVSALDDSRDPPSVGSLMICIACGALSIVDFGAIGLFMREPVPVEHARAMADPRVVNALAARAIASRRPGWSP